MSEISKISVVWSGFLGGPGVNTFYHAGSEPDLAPLASFYHAIEDMLPNSVDWDIERSGVTVDDANGDLVGGWTYTGNAITGGSGTSTAGYESGVGAVVRWETGSIENKRRVRGHTYLVPAAGNQFDGSGTLTGAARDIIQAAARTCVTDSNDGMLVWHRPKGAVAGEGKLVTTAFVPTTPAFLKSRRV